MYLKQLLQYYFLLYLYNKFVANVGVTVKRINASFLTKVLYYLRYKYSDFSHKRRSPDFNSFTLLNNEKNIFNTPFVPC